MGLCTARLFHAESAQLVLADISGKDQQVAAELGVPAVGVITEIRTASDVHAIIELAIETIGGICSVASMRATPRTLTETTEENFDYMIDINLWAPCPGAGPRISGVGAASAIPDALKRNINTQ